MAGKQTTIIEQTGGRELALPDCIARGLAAYDRVTYYLALLQAAQAQAQSPQRPAPSLRALRESSGIVEEAFDRIVEDSVSRGNGTTYVPGACAILESLFDNLRYMAATIELAGIVQPDLRDRSGLYRRRLESLAVAVQGCKDDQVTSATVHVLTSQTRNGHDTVHHLATDMHAELDRLQSAISTETIDGARAFGVTDADRPFVRAFMAGVHETAGLKFSHPGMNTTVAGDGRRLSIQNDFGSSPVHLIAIHVEDRVVTITYTDEHRARLRFLEGLLDAYTLTWTSTAGADTGRVMTAVGKYVAETTADIERFLRFLGSRLVFLIDWNRARKRLARLVSKSAAVELLRWAADSNIGHRGFLEAGDLGLVEKAFERAVPTQTRFAVRLDEVLGEQPARQFLMAVLRTASWGVATGQSPQLIEDQIEAELLRHLETPEHHALAGAAHQAAIIITLAERVRLELVRRKTVADPAGHEETSGSQPTALAHVLLAQADALRPGDLKPLFNEAAAAASALEESAFLLPLMPPAIDGSLWMPLELLADQVSATARAYVRCLEEGQDLSAMSDRVEIDNFLVTIDRLAAAGRDASGTKRSLTERLLRSGADCRQFYAVNAIGEGLEGAASRLSRCGAIVRDQVLRTRLAR